jgi:hypothetical protein
LAIKILEVAGGPGSDPVPTVHDKRDRASPFTEFTADWKATASGNGRRSHIESSPEVLLSRSQELLDSEPIGDEAF